ncbi:MAG: cyclodeaminase/cyclohydrolase family protein, partial [Actinomycetes bacterium]
AYGRYLRAQPGERAQALSDATDVPLAVAEVAAEVAALADGLARDGNPRLRGDAVAGVLLAAAAAETAAVLVGENLPDDPRAARAAACADAARAVADAAR